MSYQIKTHCLQRIRKQLTNIAHTENDEVFQRIKVCCVHFQFFLDFLPSIFLSIKTHSQSTKQNKGNTPTSASRTRCLGPPHVPTPPTLLQSYPKITSPSLLILLPCSVLVEMGEETLTYSRREYPQPLSTPKSGLWAGRADALLVGVAAGNSCDGLL
jgi:hypothetical protein